MDRPLPQFLVSDPAQPSIVTQIIESLSLTGALKQEESKFGILKDSTDTFYFHEALEDLDLQVFYADGSTDPATWQPKHVIVYRNGLLPSPNRVHSRFDLPLFFRHLSTLHSPSASNLPSAYATKRWHIGQALFFSPQTTSTQTLLEKNPTLLTSLPTPIVSIAEKQLTGRGRGSNIWSSPEGCLQFSLHLRIDTTRDAVNNGRGIPTAKLVFIQYLMSIAICEACRDEGVIGGGAQQSEEYEGDGWRVRIKWPNDIYALFGPRGASENELERKKIGGILVNTSFGTDGLADVIIGVGLDVRTLPPVFSLVQLLRSNSEYRDRLTMERVAATILFTFENLWDQFIASSGNFEPFIKLYLQRWLHSDQSITLTTITPPIQVRIVGISLDYGLLRAIPETKDFEDGYPRLYQTPTRREEQFIDLQPDGNSFDLMQGLIRAK